MGLAHHRERLAHRDADVVGLVLGDGHLEGLAVVRGLGVGHPAVNHLDVSVEIAEEAQGHPIQIRLRIGKVGRGRVEAEVVCGDVADGEAQQAGR